MVGMEMQNKSSNILDNKRWDPPDVTLAGHHKKGVIFHIKEGDERKVDKCD